MLSVEMGLKELASLKVYIIMFSLVLVHALPLSFFLIDFTPSFEG